MKRSAEIVITMAMLGTVMSSEADASASTELQTQPTAVTYEHTHELGASALLLNREGAEWTVSITLPDSVTDITPTQIPEKELEEISAARQVPLQIQSLQSEIAASAPPSPNAKAQQSPKTANMEGVTDATIDMIVATINESINSYSLYQMDPALIRDTASFLLHNGFTLQGTAAILGALMTEHKLNTDGDGIVQWTGGRKERINPQETDTVREQLQKMVGEMQEFYAGVYDDLRNSELTIQQAINAMQRYEGAGILGRRGEFSHTIFTLLQEGQAYVLVLLNK